MSKIGIFGGTFNPIHKGHIELANYCKKEIGLDKVILVPTYTPPHKNSDNLASADDRLNMCKIASAKFQDFEVSDIEIKRKGASYTYLTLEYLKDKFINDTLYLLMGADMFLTLDSWKNPKQIFRCAKIVAIPRDDESYTKLVNYYENTIKPMGADAVILKSSVISVSSTKIRNNLKEQVTNNLLDNDVLNYIKNNKLYQV